MDLDTLLAAEPDHHAGRPKDATRDDALRAAALELLAEIGYDRLTVDKIAARAGAGKATIYRRWSGKAELIVDAIACQKVVAATPDTGSLRGDFDAMIDLALEHDGRLDTEVMIGLVSALPRDEELRGVFEEHFIAPHLATLSDVVRRAEIRGEIGPVDHVETIVSILPALVLHRLITTGRAPDREFLRSTVDDVLLPLLGPRKPRT